jgi:hypothetical protein
VGHPQPPSIYARRVEAYALAELGERLAVDVFVRREDAFAALQDALTHEPEWAATLFVAAIELEQEVCLN